MGMEEMQKDAGAEVAKAEPQVAVRRVVPPIPSMTEAGLRHFRSVLAESKCYAEYGSGGSTRLAAKMGIPQIYSVESDVAFARAVKSYVRRDNKANSKFELVVPPVGETGSFGYPTGTKHCSKWWRYPVEIWNVMDAAGATPDLVLVDGRFRVASFLVSLLRSQPGTRILFDDFGNRLDKYGVVERVVKPSSMHERLAHFDVPSQFDVRLAAMLLIEYSNDRR
jgi:hypothetical protein